MREAAVRIKGMGPRQVLITGGHLPGSPVDLHPDTTGHSWAGLTEGTTYYVRVTAVNSLGEGAPSGLVPVVAMSTPAAVAPVL